MTKLSQILNESLSYNSDAKKAFISEARAVLKRVAKKLGLSASDYSISVNQGGIACSGEISLKTSKLYVNVSQGFNENVMFRTVEPVSTNGGVNHWMSAEELESEKGINRLLSLV